MLLIPFQSLNILKCPIAFRAGFFETKEPINTLFLTYLQICGLSFTSVLSLYGKELCIFHAHP